MPARTAKQARPTRKSVAFVVRRNDGTVLLRQRPAKGLLGGMMEVPSSPWIAATDLGEAMVHAPVDATWTTANETVVHVFTHFRLEVTVMSATVSKKAGLRASANPDRCKWLAAGALDTAALPTVMRKILAAGMR